MKSIENPKLLTTRKGKPYDGNYAMKNELPSLWTFLKKLWQSHAKKNVTKRMSSKLRKENDNRQDTNLKELDKSRNKFSNTQRDNEYRNPTKRKEKDIKTITPTYETPAKRDTIFNVRDHDEHNSRNDRT